MCDPSDASLPPTSNYLNREERLRLLRSSRKLGALLGITPMLINTELSESDYVAPLASPRTKTRRREGRVFPGRAASPTSSISSVDDYVVVPQGGQSSDYQHVLSEGQETTLSTSAAAAARRASVSDRARASNVSIGTTASRKRKARGPIPVALVFDMPRSGSGSGAGTQPRSAAASRFGTNSGRGASMSKKATAGMKPSNRAQPQPSLFLRLRPAFGRSSNIKQQPVPANSPYIYLPQTNPPSPHAPASPTRLSLSPSMATFANSNLSTASIASSHYSSKGGYLDTGKASQPYDEFDNMDTTPDGRRALTERDRRRKMAKLARTLGENVPPELVFRPPPPTRRTSGAYTSASFGLQSYPKPPPPPPVVPGLPKLAVADAPIPRPAPTAIAPAPSTTSRKSRPRSLTLAPASNTDATRGTTSMDAPASPAMVQGSHRVTKSLGRAKSIKGSSSVAASASSEPPFEEYSDASRSASRAGANGASGFGRRKEREWSGEWNLKDMNDVAARLRGLKA